MLDTTNSTQFSSLMIRELQTIARLPLTLEFYVDYVEKVEAANPISICPELKVTELESQKARLIFAASMRHKAFWETYFSDEEFRNYFSDHIPEDHWDDAAAQLAYKGKIEILPSGIYMRVENLKNILAELPYYSVDPIESC